jgi:hypothetical protein
VCSLSAVKEKQLQASKSIAIVSLAAVLAAKAAAVRL